LALLETMGTRAFFEKVPPLTCDFCAVEVHHLPVGCWEEFVSSDISFPNGNGSTIYR
jgi:hypothetical protein